MGTEAHEVGDKVMHDDGSREGVIVEIRNHEAKVDWGFQNETWVDKEELISL